MRDAADTADERLQRRRVRRLKRRARILGPFLGLPLLIFTLSLSVDLVEYQPREEPDRLTDRPIRMTGQRATQPTLQPSPWAATPVNSPIVITKDDPDGTHSDSIDLDVMLPSAHLLRPPAPPHALKRR